MKMFLLGVLALGVAMGAVMGGWLRVGDAPTEVGQPAFERVSSSRTLRCAYAVWAPFFMVDPNTGAKSGIAYDIVEQMGKILGLEVVWTEEVPYSQVADNLKGGRNDAMCMTLWPSGNRALALDFTSAVDYIGAYAFVREGDGRFDGNLAAINRPGVTIAMMDGDYTQAIADEDFGQSGRYNLSMDADGAQLFLAVASGKADVVFADPFLGYEFAKANPGKVRRVKNVPPARVFGDVFAVAKGETRLRDSMNAALAMMNQNGFIRATLDRYLGEYKGEYFYPALPYMP